MVKNRSRERGRDIGKRKTRSDLGKRRKKYAGKPTKKKRKVRGKYVSYPSRTRKKTTIKLYCWGESSMSLDGFKKFPLKIRRFVNKTVYGKGKLRIRIDASVYDINTREKFENFCANHLFEGIWLILGFSHKKNKYHVSPTKMAKVQIKDNPSGTTAMMLRNYSLFRRWWWKG